MSDHDLEMARRIPDDFLGLPDSPLDRIINLINRHWSGYDPRARAELAQALLPVLLDLVNSGTEVRELHRGLCQNIVAAWMRRQRDLHSRAS